MVSLIAGVGDVFSFFASMFQSLPAVFYLLAQFCFGTMLLFGLMHLFRR